MSIGAKYASILKFKYELVKFDVEILNVRNKSMNMN